VKKPMRHFRLLVAVAGALSLAAPLFTHAAGASTVSPPNVPSNLQVPNGNMPFEVGHAVGVQIYSCQAQSDGTFAWTFVAPSATLFNDKGSQIATHFLSNDPSGTPRPTWQANDGSKVWGKRIASSADPNFVAPGAIPWLLLQAAATALSPDRSDRFASTTYIQRVHTAGGVAPTSVCDASHVGATANQNYTADYYFYRPTG
jgi:hypothetical protein